MISPPREMPPTVGSPDLDVTLPPAAVMISSNVLLHVLGLQDLVLAPLEVEAQHRNAPLIDHVRIDLAVAVLVGNHLAAAGEVNVGAVDLAEVALQFLP